MVAKRTKKASKVSRSTASTGSRSVVSKPRKNAKSTDSIKPFGLKYFILRFKGWWRRNWWNKLVAIVVSLILLSAGGMYGIAKWYSWSNRHKPMQLGVTFIPSYARYLNVDPKETMQAMIDELGVRHFRLVSYWEVIEATPGQYDFSELDWQFEKANQAGAAVSLSIGLRQPRWPECHMPDWAKTMTKDEWYPHLKVFMQKVIEHYKDNPALQDYQLENEFSS